MRADLQGPALRAKRVAAGLTQRALAARLGVTQEAVSAWERGLWRPSPKHLHELAHVLVVHRGVAA